LTRADLKDPKRAQDKIVRGNIVPRAGQAATIDRRFCACDVKSLAAVGRSACLRPIAQGRLSDICLTAGRDAVQSNNSSKAETGKIDAFAPLVFSKRP
jgi:hypothetical protein